MAPFKDYYKILQVDPSAELDIIEVAFRRLSKLYYPIPGRNTEEKFKEITEAHSVLKDPIKREKYDNEYKKFYTPKPKPEVDKNYILFKDVTPGEIKTDSFILRNSGGNYENIDVSVQTPNSWLKIIGVNSLDPNQSDELPLKINIEATVDEWGKDYDEYIVVKLDDEEIKIKVELNTRYDEIYNRFTSKVIKKSKPLKKILIPIAVVFIILLISVFGIIYFKYYSNNSSTSTISTTIIESSPVLAVVNAASIKQNAVDTYVEFLKNQEPTSVPADDTPEFKTLQTNILDSLIVLNVLENYGNKNNFKVTQKEIDDAYQNIVKNYPSESDLEKDLVAKKISKNFLMDQIKSQVLRDKIFTDVTKNVTVTDAEVKKYYDDNKETLFKVPEQIQVSHILIKFNVPEGQELTEQLKKEAYDKIKAVQEKLKSGEDFAALAKSYSEDTASKENGGDIGLISAGQTIKEFEDAAFALKVGEVSDIVETTYGYHLIKVTDHKDAYIKDFSEVTDTIKSYLLNSKQTGEWEKFISDLIIKTNIKYTTDLKGALLDINKK